MNLKIIIHIGPPKTGTSAIQKWLKDNIPALLAQGVYYPQHHEDSNGISSGNFLSVFEEFEGDYRFCLSRLSAVKADAVTSKCHTLLLSSEYFFSRLLPMLDILPDLLCVAYVRNPAELHESNYNQSVKRHGNIEVIRRAPALPMHTLKVLGEYAERLDSKLILRAYHEKLFVNGSIVLDFLHAIELQKVIIEDLEVTKRINSSYSLEALEVKRWFNRYQLGLCENQLDRILQAYDDGISAFTFIDRNQFNDYKRQSIHWISMINEQAPFISGQSLINILRQEEHKPFYRQEITSDQCLNVLCFIRKHDTILLNRLAFCVYAQPNIINLEPFTDCLFSLANPQQAMPSLWQHIKMTYFRGNIIDSVVSFDTDASGIAESDTKVSQFRIFAQYLVSSRVKLVAYLKALWVAR